VHILVQENVSLAWTLGGAERHVHFPASLSWWKWAFYRLYGHTDWLELRPFLYYYAQSRRIYLNNYV